MKKPFLLITACVLIAAGLVFSCNKKKSSGVSPTYGTTGNPNPSNNTVTGNTTYTNPATESSALYLGGSGWSNPTCGTTNSIALRGVNGSIDVTLAFSSSITPGTYAVSSVASSSVCGLSILNAPNQPAGIVWYGKSGTVVVTTTSTSINANLFNVVCTQQAFNFPIVSVTGFLSCGQ